ncbi:DUF6682 family protein [Comamonas jiangduensis]|uniref:phage adaptor protein n=1 Tax=Comamonas jiangduensis TaxID=1194168 RepID=UPI003BF797DD
MNIRELIAQARVALADQAEPYLWSDEDLLGYFNEAVQEACERALLIQDLSTPTVCIVSVQAGQAICRLHPSVLKVERASINGGLLDEASIESLDAQMGDWESRKGQPRQFVFMQSVGDGNPGLRLVPEPKLNAQLKLRVYRGPLQPMKLAGVCQTPEIASRHHPKLINWVARCAYLRPDADGYDRDRAQLHEAMFERDFGARPDANVQRKRRDKRPRLVKPHW